VVDSTRLLDELGPARYAEALADHRQLLRAAFERHEGLEVDTQGDSFFVVFQTAKDAVAAAVAAQSSVAAKRWPAGVQLPVRMGLHTGEPVLTATGYVGLDVHRAARICSAGHGGQVLVSQATRELIGSELPDGVELRDLGEHRLKDLSSPHRLFQVLIAGMPGDFPPLKTLETSPTNLPAQPTPLLGRERELMDVCNLLLRDEVRLLTFTGAGGTGKTRLALQAAAELLEEFPSGVCFVALAPIREPALIVPSIARTLGLREGGSQPLQETLVEYLRDEQVLLVLDNFEQLRQASPVLSELLAACSGLKLLVTSRAPLRLSGEHLYPVPPLLLPDRERPPELRLLAEFEAVALFIARAQAVKPDFVLTRDNAAAVAEICHRLDGLPLAIELTAARTMLLSPQAMLERLGQRLQLLTGGARDLPARQRTLRSTIDWSHGLLAEGEQRLLARLAVFVGGRTLHAAQAVCNPDRDLGPDVLDGLATLVENNLLRQEAPTDGEPRFSMLETIHEYALERLRESGELAALRRRHAEYLLALAEEAEPQLVGPNQVVWLERLEREHENLRAALAWAVDAAPNELALRLTGALRIFWRVRGHLSEGRRWLEAALARAEDESAGPRAKALYAASVLALRQGDYGPAKAWAQESLVLSRGLGDSRGAGRALQVLGSIAVGERAYDEATRLFEESEALCRKIGDKSLLATTILDLGDVALNQAEYERATVLLEESLALFQELGDKDGTAIALYNLGSAALSEGRDERAVGLLSEGLALFGELGYKEGIAYCLEALAAATAAGASVVEAARLLGAADAASEAMGAALEPGERDRHERTKSMLRGELGEERFAQLWHEGRTMTLDEAVQYARERFGGLARL
jgi:predicted ATPase